MCAFACHLNKRLRQYSKDEIKKDRPRLDIAHALVQVYTGDLDAGEGALSLSCQAADRLEPEESARIEAYILAIEAYALWIRGS